MCAHFVSRGERNVLYRMSGFVSVAGILIRPAAEIPFLAQFDYHTHTHTQITGQRPGRRRLHQHNKTPGLCDCTHRLCVSARRARPLAVREGLSAARRLRPASSSSPCACGATSGWRCCAFFPLLLLAFPPLLCRSFATSVCLCGRVART